MSRARSTSSTGSRTLPVTEVGRARKFQCRTVLLLDRGVVQLIREQFTCGNRTEVEASMKVIRQTLVSPGAVLILGVVASFSLAAQSKSVYHPSHLHHA